MNRTGIGLALRALGTAALAGNMIWLSVPSVSAAEMDRSLVLDAGTVLPARLNDTLSSQDSRRGDSFTATLNTNDSGYYNQLPDGTRIEGVVQTARPQDGKDPGMLELKFQRLRFPDGRSVPIDGSLIGLDNKSVTRTADGRLIAKPNHRNDRLTYLGYGAGAGLIIGALTKHTLEDTLIGGGLGYLFGSLQKGNNNPSNITLKPGSQLGVRLDHRVVYSSDTSDTQGSYGQTDSQRYYRTHGSDRHDNINAGVNATDVGVLVGDQNVSFDSTARPVMSRGTVLIPFRPVLKAAHVDFDYNADRGVLTAMAPDNTVKAYVGSRIARLSDGSRVRMEAPVQRLNGTLYVPVKFLSLATGQRVHWDPESRTIEIAPND